MEKDDDDIPPAPKREQFEQRKDFVRAYDRWRDKYDTKRKARVRPEGYQRTLYAKHREKRLAEKKADYEARREVLLSRQAQWRDGNRDKLQARDKRRYQADPTAICIAVKRHKPAIKRASPPWLTADHWLEINSLYQEAMRLTEETGKLHTVDHIWPLKGTRSCGLHVPWNLQILLFGDNVRKGRNEPD